MSASQEDDRSVRAHKMVKHIGNNLSDSLAKHSRVLTLPEMIQRHGILQVVAFLESKKRDSSKKRDAKLDGELLGLLEQTVQKITGTSIELKASPRAADAKKRQDELTLAGLDLGRYLFVNELALEAASWIARIAQARCTLQEEESSQREKTKP